jgi:prepilin-type N-terminal cleavage/methylation domain-containing protein
MVWVRQGFSLIELTVVLGIVSLLVGMVHLNTSFLVELSVHQELNKLRAIAYYLQRIAQFTGREQVLVFDVVGRSYSFNDRHEVLPQGVSFGVLPGVKGPPSSPVHTIKHPVTFKENRITFYPEGIVQAGTVYLLHAQRPSMYALSCGVGHVSFLRKYRYDKTWVLLGV